MSDFLNDLEKYRQISSFEMRRAYDEKKEDEKALIDSDIMYDKKRVMDENASLERLLDISNTSLKQLPPLTRTMAREILFSNKSYLLINENSKEDSPYMTNVKNAVRDLQNAMYEEPGSKDLMTQLEKIPTLYQTAIDRCDEYLKRGGEKKRRPFWPWHKKRFDAVDDMAASLEAEKAAYEAKLNAFKRTDLGSVGEQYMDSDELNTVKQAAITETYMLMNSEGSRIKSPMDVLLIDRFDVIAVNKEQNFLKERTPMLFDDEKAMEKLMKSDNIPKDLERMRFIGAFLMGHREDKKKNFAEVYAEHYNINLADMGKEENLVSEHSMAMEQKEIADKFLNKSDAGRLLIEVNSIRRATVSMKDLPDVVATLDKNLKDAKKMKTMSISPEIRHMSEVLAEQLKLFSKHPVAMLSQLDEKHLTKLLGLKVPFVTYCAMRAANKDADDFDQEALLEGVESDEVINEDDYVETSAMDLITKKEHLKSIVKDNPVFQGDRLIPYLLQMKDVKATETYYKYIMKNSLTKMADAIIDVAKSYNNMQQM